MWSLRAAVPPLDVRMTPVRCPEMLCQRCAPAAAYEIGRDMSFMYASSHSKWLNVGWSHVRASCMVVLINFCTKRNGGINRVGI